MALSPWPAGHVGAVGEAAVLAEEVLEGQGLLVVGGRTRGGLPGDALGLGAEPVGELQRALRPIVGDLLVGAAQLLGREVREHRQHVVGGALGGGARRRSGSRSRCRSGRGRR